MRRALRHGVRPCTTTAGGDHLHLSAYWRRWTDWVLTTDKRQRIRLAMSGLAALLMVCCLVVMN